MITQQPYKLFDIFCDQLSEEEKCAAQLTLAHFLDAHKLRGEDFAEGWWKREGFDLEISFPKHPAFQELPGYTEDEVRALRLEEEAADVVAKAISKIRGRRVPNDGVRFGFEALYRGIAH